MKTTVVYHSADYDGIFCREIARKFMPDTKLIGWNFGDPPIKMASLLETPGQIYVLDLPVDRPFGFDYGMRPRQPFVDPQKFVWIDHHKTSIDTHPADIPGYRIDGVAACRLAWAWFSTEGNVQQVENLPVKDDYVNRAVREPLAVRLAGEYDIWDKRDERTDTFQYALRCQDGELDWKALLADKPGRYIESLLEGGKWAQHYAQKTDADLVTHRSYRLQWEGLNFIVLNTGRFNSLTFAALDKPETGHDALMGYMFNGKVWTVSLYHAKHRTDLDLSAIAIKHGGGGHKGACGFTCKTLPFQTT